MLNKKNIDEEKDIRNDFLLESIYKIQNFYTYNKKFANKILISFFTFLGIVLIYFYIDANRNYEADKIFNRGMSYYKSGDIELALIEFEDLKLNFNSTKKGILSFYFIGKINFDDEKYNESLIYFKNYLKRGKSKSYLSSTFSMLAMINSINNEHLKAAKEYEKASEITISQSFKNRLLFQSLNSYLKSKDLINSEKILDILKNNDDVQKNQKDEYERIFNYYKTLKKRISKN
tara:strand:- start:12811 stop:13509 length:699 start_codon:yes stop_codon:yes gene_type:complete